MTMDISPRAFPRIVLAAAILLARPSSALAQQTPAPRDTLRLGALQDAAVRADPRGRQVDLLAAQSALRLRSLEAQRLPTLGVNAQGQYQSTVVSIPFALPNDVRPASPPNDSYDAHIDARERIYDPTLGVRRGLERAQLAESQAHVRASLYTLRENVNEAYFNALLFQHQRAEVEAGITELEAQLRVAQDRVRLGSALPSEAAMLEAEVRRRRQSAGEMAENRDVALVVLGDLTGRAITSADALALPDLADAVASVRARSSELRARPEYEQFARSRDVLEQQRVSAAVQDRPRVSAFGRAGYGRPGLNPLASDFNPYWLAGIQVDWSPWNWGTTRRDRDVLSLQEEIVAGNEAAFTASIRRGVARDLATMDRLERALGEDESIIALRAQVLGETRFRFTEGMITSAEFVDRETDLLLARLARAAHRTELAQARARFLTTLGLEVR